MVRVALVTACGGRKEKVPSPAWRLYKSTRIRYLYKIAKELGIQFFILSAKYGLVDADTVIAPYDQIMDAWRAYQLLPQVKEQIKDFDVIVFYKGGAREEYQMLMMRACKEMGKKLIVCGYGNMGDVGKVKAIVKSLLVDGGDKYG